MIRVLGWTLLHFVWQGAAVAALLASLNLALRRATPQARYLAACVSLLLMLALPALTFRAVSAAEAAPSTTPARTLADAMARTLAPARAAEAAAFAQPTLPRPFDLGRRIEAMLPGLVTLWVAGVLLLGVRSLGGLTLVRRLGRTGLRAAPAGLEATLARLAQALRVSAPVRLYESALVGAPTVVGWFRPVILLPASALTGLTAQQLELILAHELAHVRRHDYLVNLLQSAAETLLFYHPAVWWVSNRMRVEREHCCDDLAVSACGSAVRYARALVELEGLCSDAPAFAVAANGGSLFDRIVRLVGRTPEPSRAARGFAALAAVAGLALAFGFGSILLDRPTPTIVDVLASSQSLDKTAPLAAPVAIAQAEAKSQPQSASPKPQPAAAAKPQPAPAAKPQPAASAQRAEATPQARAFPLERVNLDRRVGEGADIDACGLCAACTRIARGVHSDVIVVEPGESGSIKIEQIRDIVDRAAYRVIEDGRPLDRAPAPVQTNAAATVVKFQFHPHPPYENNECTKCHESRFSVKMRGPMLQVCSDCHQHQEFGKAIVAAKVKHQPVENGECNSCHDPHGSANPKMLVQTGQTLPRWWRKLWRR
jgi:predicted CXXCH cytochrome family protein